MALYKVRLGVALPVGVGDVAEDVRAALTGGFDGWVLPRQAEPGELLWSRKQQLPGRVFHTLERAQFRTVDEVALVPDEGLRTLRGMGPGSLRAAVPTKRFFWALVGSMRYAGGSVVLEVGEVTPVAFRTGGRAGVRVCLGCFTPGVR